MLKKIYPKFVEKFLLPLGSFLSGNNMYSYLSYLRQCDHKTYSELKKEQTEKLSKLIRYAIEKSPYYNQLQIELTNNAIENLKKFPILTKELLRKNYHEMLTVPETELIKRFSSGTSGIPSFTFMNKKEIGMTQATQLHWMNWAGYCIGKPILQTGMSKRTFLKKMKDIFFRTTYISAYSLKEKDMVDVLQKIKSNDCFLLGYASSLYLLALTKEKYNLDTTFTSASSLGDKLFLKYKKKITEQFKCDTFDTYGCCEGFMMAATNDLPYYYIMTPNVYLEIVDEHGNEVPDGELGHVVVTNLNAYSMPMIRYKLGDLAVKLPKDKYPVNKKFGYPLLQKIIGRDTDIIITPIGSRIIVHEITEIFDDFYNEISQYQVIQKNEKSIIILYIPGNKYHYSIQEKINNRFYSLSQEDKETFTIFWTETTNVLKTKSGKPQIIISATEQHRTI